jgi:LPS-assembly lipoprotein
MPDMKTSYRLIAGLGALTLSACGFHLRGVGETTPFPFNSLRVAVSAGGIGDVVRRQLSLQPNIKLVPADPADAVLSIEPERYEKQILTVNRSGRVSEYLLNYQVKFRLQVDKRDWIYPTVLTLHRDYTFNETNPLGNEAQEQLLLRDMRLDAATQIIRRVAAAKAAGQQVSEQEPTPAATPATPATPR